MVVTNTPEDTYLGTTDLKTGFLQYHTHTHTLFFFLGVMADVPGNRECRGSPWEQKGWRTKPCWAMCGGWGCTQPGKRPRPFPHRCREKDLQEFKASIVGRRVALCECCKIPNGKFDMTRKEMLVHSFLPALGEPCAHRHSQQSRARWRAFGDTGVRGWHGAEAGSPTVMSQNWING